MFALPFPLVNMSSSYRWILLAAFAVVCLSHIAVDAAPSKVATSAGATPPATAPSSSSASSTSTAVVLDSATPLTHFIFGSCNHQEKDQPMWKWMHRRDPQLFLWMGDVIYADNVMFEFVRRPSPISAMQLMYSKQYNHEEYRSFRANRHVIGIYDDHDYGKDDGDTTYPDKEPSRQLFLDFLDEPRESPRRFRDGIYADYIFGPKGKRVKFILLDSRYNLNPVEDDMLGQDQWTWLENSISSDTGIDLYILVSGVQLVSREKRIGEGWRLKPKSRARVFDLLARRHVNQQAGVVFLSGDVHFAEADVTYWCTRDESASSAATTVSPFYEFTSSGLTHSITTQFGSLLTDYGLPLVLRERVSSIESEDPSQSIRGLFTGLNFGDFEIDWEGRSVRVKIIDQYDQERLAYSLAFQTLQSHTYTNSFAIPALVQRKCDEEKAAEQSPAPMTIGGVKFGMLVILLLQLGVAVVAASVWHFAAKRAEYKSKRIAAREIFKVDMEEKKKERERERKKRNNNKKDD